VRLSGLLEAWTIAGLVTGGAANLMA